MRSSQHNLMALAAAALLALPACSSVLNVDVQLVLKTCAGTPELDPLANVQQLRFTVYGEGIDSFSYQTTALLLAQRAEVPGIPAGVGRNIVVEALGTGDQLVARGESGPLDLTSDEPITTAIFLRRIDAFTPSAVSGGPTTCSEMIEPRIAHTATLLGNGNVLIAGGYTVTATGRTYLRSTEIFDPHTGAFKAGPDMNNKRANHTATRIAGTQLTVIAGGESEFASNTAGAALRTADIYDEATNGFNFTALVEARTKHAAAIPPAGSGRLLLVGGYNAAGAALTSTEEFDVQARKFEAGPRLPKGRGELGAVGVGDGKIVIAGGFDGAGVVKTVNLFVARDTGKYELMDDAQFPAALPEGRLWPLLVALNDDSVIVTGGFTEKPASDLLYGFSSSITHRINIATRAVVPTSAGLTVKRGHAGAIALLDGTILVAGGASVNEAKPVAHGSADLIYPDERANGGIAVRAVNGSMKEGRYHARYTLLADGTVLVTGGLFYEADNTPRTLRSAELFQPRYQATKLSPYR